MNDENLPPDAVEPEEDVEAQLLKETLGAGLAAAAIFAGTSQAGSYPVPSPPGTADAAAELALIPKKGKATRAIQQAKAKTRAETATAKKAKKVKKSAVRRAGGGRAQPH